MQIIKRVRLGRTLTPWRNAPIFAHKAGAVLKKPETNRAKVVSRLAREGWIERHGGEHDVFKRPDKPGRIIVPRHRTLSSGVARVIARQAGWQ